MREITGIVVHCSASRNGQPVTIEDITAWHIARGFRTVGYHYVIEIDGGLVEGRPETEIGAHVEGSNAKTIGVCMVGTDKFSRAQWDALATLVAELRVRYPKARVKGHRDYSPDKDGDGVVEPWEWLKTCPGFDVQRWLIDGYVPEPENILA